MAHDFLMLQTYYESKNQKLSIVYYSSFLKMETKLVTI